MKSGVVWGGGNNISSMGAVNWAGERETGEGGGGETTSGGRSPVRLGTSGSRRVVSRMRVEGISE